MRQDRDRLCRALMDDLVSQDIGDYQIAASLAEHNSWQIGGPADLLVEPSSTPQVATVVSFANQHKLPLVVVGQGTNLLFDDAGVRGIVLKLGHRFSDVSIENSTITAQGGAWVPGVARKAMQAGLTGLEHTVGIPGTIGGLVLMNGGSQRKGIGDNVCCVRVVSKDGALRDFNREQCEFSYRKSALQGTGAVVVQVELECKTSEPGSIRRMMLDDLRQRRRKFPRKEPNCGSVFLSTSEMHASVGPPGKIIEDAGLKGARIGDAEVSRQHANFIVNRGGASSKDVLALVARIREMIKQRIGFDLCCEVRYVSPAGETMPAHKAVL